MKNLIMPIIVIVGMIFYVGWIFYMSEPKYEDGPDQNIKKFDIVSSIDFGTVSRLGIGMVIQIDSTSFNNKYATVKIINGYSWDSFERIEIGTLTPRFHIIGHGTFYHKVNHFIGFNIMRITSIVILILGFVLLIFLLRNLNFFE